MIATAWQKLIDCYKVIIGTPTWEGERLRIDLLNSQNNNAELKIKVKEMQELLSAQASSIEKLSSELESIRPLAFDDSTLESLAGLMSQIRLQENLISQGKEISAKNIMKLTIGLVETLEESCLSPIASVGEKVAFDPKIHKSIDTVKSMDEGARALVKFIGYHSNGRAIRKALVEEAE